MKQHNHWKMRQFQKAIVKLVLWGFGLVFFILTVVFKKTIDFNLVSETVSVISMLLGLCLTLVERTLWKTKLMQLPFLENYWTPILEGRWEGKLLREGIPHDFVIEIKQSFTSISCITYSEHSSSCAYASEILYNDQLKKYQLIYYWHGDTTNVQENTGDSNSFDGLTVLDIIIECGRVTRLKGTYFTNRQPKQTKGSLVLKFRQKELKNSFD